MYNTSAIWRLIAPNKPPFVYHCFNNMLTVVVYCYYMYRSRLLKYDTQKAVHYSSAFVSVTTSRESRVRPPRNRWRSHNISKSIDSPARG